MHNSSLDINIEQRSYRYLNLSKNNNNSHNHNNDNDNDYNNDYDNHNDNDNDNGNHYNSGNLNNSNYRHNLSDHRLRFPAHNSRNEERKLTEDDDRTTRHRSGWAISEKEKTEGEEKKESAEKLDSLNLKSETEEYYSTDDTDSETERMQLNPSTDFYDEDDDEDDDADDVYMDESSDRFEMMPEAKKLIQTSTTEAQNVDRIEIRANDEDEEDMGYDEDDERIAAGRSSHTHTHNKEEKGYMNEEGSGGVSSDQAALKNRYKSNLNDNRFSLAYLRKQHKNGQSSMTESKNGQEVGTRESSGNFANDDDEDDDDDDDDDEEDDGNEDDANERSNENGDGFFNAKRKPNNRYFRKNTNDAIKIISTPLGKVGILYQQTPTQNEDAAKRAESNDKKPQTSLTDFDALSPDPDSSLLASSHPKITPVLTPDGKVALLYRGDSENTKYEPIRNLTHKFNAKKTNSNNGNSNNGNGNSNNNTFDNKESAINNIPNSESNGYETSSENNDNYDNNDDDDMIITNPIAGHENTNAEESNPTNKHASYSPVNIAPTSGSFIVRPTDSVLPMINKPLSEVLGIKKNQFKQFRVKDVLSTTSTDGIPRTLPGTTQNEQSTTNLHFLTKVNLAEYPTSARSRNRDFDFSQDNTMLDERSRHKSQDQFQSNDLQNGKNNADALDTFTNEEVLSKTEVVDLAIIPHFDNELDRLNRYDTDGRRHHRNRQTIHRRRQNDEDLSGIHCVMQAMMGIAAISTVFGMLGTFFKQRILDQIRLMHW